MIMATDPITKNTIDELLSYDFSDDGDPFNDKPSKKRDDKTVLSPRTLKRTAEDADKENFGGLGLDEEVKITKKKRPNPKLDEQRLLSAQGIPKLRAFCRSGKIAKKLHLKGKGHEFSDVARLLNYYQLWLDDLFPRAKFADGLVMIEKVGHTKRMAINRKEWIDEGKPGYARDKTLRKEQEEHEKGQDDANEVTKANGVDNEEPSDMFFGDSTKAKDEVNFDQPQDDELDALLAERTARPSPKKVSTPADDSEGEDDLEALLAEQESRRNPPMSINRKKTIEYENDDLDALLTEQENPSNTKPNPPMRARNTIFDDDEQEDDDLDVLLAEQESRKKPELPLAPKTDLIDGSLQSLGHAPEEAEDEGFADMLSSPLSNNPEEDDLADFLSSPIPNDD
jgi:replication fork protection complex subunit Csm3/Swi3